MANAEGVIFEMKMLNTKTSGRTVRLFVLRTRSRVSTRYRGIVTGTFAYTFAPTIRAVQLYGSTVRANAPKSLAGQENGFCGGVSRNRATEIPDPLLPSGRPAYALSFTQASASPC